MWPMNHVVYNSTSSASAPWNLNRGTNKSSLGIYKLQRKISPYTDAEKWYRVTTVTSQGERHLTFFTFSENTVKSRIIILSDSKMCNLDSIAITKNAACHKVMSSICLAARMRYACDDDSLDIATTTLLTSLSTKISRFQV